MDVLFAGKASDIAPHLPFQDYLFYAFFFCAVFVIANILLHFIFNVFYSKYS